MTLLLMVAAVSVADAATLVRAERAAALVADGALVLDTRSSLGFLAGHVPGAVSVDWRLGVVGGARSGLLGDPRAVAAAFGALGVSEDRPVLVVGDWEAGWGEEGRIAWDLDYLGHGRTYVLEGGMATWSGELELGSTTPVPALFTAAPREELRATRAEIKAGDALILDVREPDEYAGSNLYLAEYGGHVPGAVNLPWRLLVGEDRPALPRDRPVIVYCTGGVRSGLAAIWLAEHGYQVANYDGSWWDWAAREPAAP